GEFIHGTLPEVQARVKTDPHPSPEEEDAQSRGEYKIPTQMLPSPPPPLCQDEHGDEACERIARWWLAYEHEVDDIWLRSNIHKCRESVQDQYEADRKKDWRRTEKKKPRTQGYHERRGCLSKTGICKARFPRDVYESTTIDKDGHINMKKKEPLISSELSWL
ncbi:hypothetical protein FB451DRAFT_1201317, partial [Mycena latifolia]